MTETVNQTSIEQQVANYRQFAEEQAKEGYRVGGIVLKQLDEEYKKRLAVKESSAQSGKKILIIDCSEGIGLGPLTMIADERLNGANCRIIEIEQKQELPVNFNDIAGVIITGSPANTNEKDTKKWIGQVEKFIREASDKVPVFGICFGMQAESDAEGREIINLKQVDEKGRPRLSGSRKSSNWGLNKLSIHLDRQSPHQDHPIFRGLEFQKDQKGNMTCIIDVPVHHSYSLKMETGAAEIDRRNIVGVEYPDDSGYAGININSDRVGVLGVQFHPERLTRIGFLCAYTVAQVTGEDILNSNESPEEKLRQLREWDKRLAQLKQFKDEWIDGPKKEETPPGLKIFQNFVSMALDLGYIVESNPLLVKSENDSGLVTPEAARKSLEGKGYEEKDYDHFLANGYGTTLAGSHELRALITIARGQNPQVVDDVVARLREREKEEEKMQQWRQENKKLQTGEENNK